MDISSLEHRGSHKPLVEDAPGYRGDPEPHLGCQACSAERFRCRASAKKDGQPAKRVRDAWENHLDLVTADPMAITWLGRVHRRSSANDIIVIHSSHPDLQPVYEDLYEQQRRSTQEYYDRCIAEGRTPYRTRDTLSPGALMYMRLAKGIVQEWVLCERTPTGIFRKSTFRREGNKDHAIEMGRRRLVSLESQGYSVERDTDPTTLDPRTHVGKVDTSLAWLIGATEDAISEGDKSALLDLKNQIDELMGTVRVLEGMRGRISEALRQGLV